MAAASTQVPAASAAAARVASITIRAGNGDTDRVALVTLFKAAAFNGGLARSPEEVDEAYINDMLRHAANGGLMLVAIHPQQPNQLVACIKAVKLGPQSIFASTLGDLTIAVHPEFQKIGLGARIMSQFLNIIATSPLYRHIGRVELSTRASNPAAKMYVACGFKIEGRFENRIRILIKPTPPAGISPYRYEADIPMAWLNPSFISSPTIGTGAVTVATSKL